MDLANLHKISNCPRHPHPQPASRKGDLGLSREADVLLSGQLKLYESRSNLGAFKLARFKLEAKNDLYFSHVPHRFKSKSNR